MLYQFSITLCCIIHDSRALEFILALLIVIIIIIIIIIITTINSIINII